MHIRNKKTGEIVEICKICPEPYEARDFRYNSLAELNAEWEDCDEPKEYWFIDFNGEIKEFDVLGFEWQGWMREIGNYFETKEEAEKAVEKLKAWKQLKDEGMKIYTFQKEKTGIDLDYYTLTILAPRDEESLKLIFGGEE